MPRPPEHPTTTATGDGAWLLTGEKTYVLDIATAATALLHPSHLRPSVFSPSSAMLPGLTATALDTIDQTRKPRHAHPRRHSGPTRSARSAPGLDRPRTALDQSAIALIAEQAGGAMYHADKRRLRPHGSSSPGRSAVSRRSSTMCGHTAGGPVGGVGRSSRRRRVRRPRPTASRIALAQAYCSEAYVTTAATTIQVHGGIGFTWEHPPTSTCVAPAPTPRSSAIRRSTGTLRPAARGKADERRPDSRRGPAAALENWDPAMDRAEWEPAGVRRRLVGAQLGAAMGQPWTHRHPIPHRRSRIRRSGRPRHRMGLPRICWLQTL